MYQFSEVEVQIVDSEWNQFGTISLVKGFFLK